MPAARSGSSEPDPLAASIEAYVALIDLDHSPPQQQANASLSYLVMTGYCGVCALSLVGGAVAGSRSFEHSAAHEALDKLPAATAASEATAMKYAVRAVSGNLNVHTSSWHAMRYIVA